jgi:UTP--glucose-1-phosphate uridylyltransferase
MNYLVKKCVIPIAGYGTRLFPATRAIPKAFFPIVDIDGRAKPIVQIIVSEAISSGIEEICIVTQEDQLCPIRGYFSQGDIPFSEKEIDKCLDSILEMGKRISYVVQDRPEGFGHAVYCARDFAGKDPFLLLLGDHVYVSNIRVPCSKQTMDIFRRYGVSVTSVARTRESQLRFFGAVDGERVDERVLRVSLLKEKPDVEYARANLRVDGLDAGTYLCNFGIDVLTPEILHIIGYNIRNNIRHRGEFQLRNAMEMLMEREGLYAYEVNGQRHDIGIPEEFIRTVISFGLKGPYEHHIKSLITDH